jgi:hypothetical protein
MKAVQGEKKRKYRPLTEDELRDTISKEQGADDQVRPFKERSWVKPKSMNEKTLGIKIKEAIDERTKEKKESGKPWEEWVKSRQEERLKRRRQKEEEKKDDEWPKLVSKSGSVTSTSSRAPWGRNESKQVWSMASSSSRAPCERGSEQERDMASTSSQEPWKGSKRDRSVTSTSSRAPWEKKNPKESQKSWSMASSSSRGPVEEHTLGASSKVRPQPPWHEKRRRQKSEGSLLGFSQAHWSPPSSERPKHQWQKWAEEGRERVDIVVSTSMLPKDIAVEHPMKPGMPKTYKTASKHTVEKLGEKDLACASRIARR